MIPIRPVDLPAALERVGGVADRGGAGPAASSSGSTSFAATLTDAIDQARASERTATDDAAAFASGDPAVGIHEVVIAAEKANVSLRYATTLKNKLLDAYRELMNTQV